MKIASFFRVITLSIIHLLTLSGTGNCQSASKNIHERTQAWVGYFNQSRLSKHFGTWTDIHYRRTDVFVKNNFQFLLRGALTFFFNDQLRLNAGYAFVNHFPLAGNKTSRPEHRPWQQIWWSQKYNGYNTLQWLRLEERFVRKTVNDKLTKDYNFNFRLRYNFSLFIPLKGREINTGTPFFILMDEVFINMGKRITYNYFDQNRLFIGLGYQLTSHLNAQLGYMNLFQQEASGNNYINNHVIRFFVFHSLDLRKKEGTK